MTISTTTIKNSYNGNGSTSAFNYTFKISAESEMQVIIRSASGTETVKSLTTHYTISGVGNAGGGAVTFTAGNIPVSGETVILRRVTAQTQAMDLIDNDPMSADTIENAHDKSIAIAQELQEQIDRSIKLSRTNTMTSTEFTVDAASRANKILAFDSAGEISVTQELGTFVGDWSSGTSYNARDLVKDTSTNNIFICTTSHTSSGSQPLTTNTDSAKWSLLVDAASATTSATTATTQAGIATTKASEASASASAALTSENNAATSETNASNSATTSANEATASANSATAAAGSASAAAATFDLFDDAYLGAKASNPTLDNDGDALQDGALYFDTTNDVMKVYNLANTTWYQLTPTVSNQTNINTLSAISGDVTQAASDSADIQTVASDSADIRALADIEDGTTATNAVSNAGNNATSIAIVAGQISPTNNISSVAAIAADITSVANIDSDVTAVANDLTDIGTVATDLAGSNNIGTVAGLNTEIAALGASGTVASINTVASNISDVNNFADTYSIGASAPSSPTLGDLWFDSANNVMKVYGSGGFVTAASAVNGTANRFKYTATASQTTFTGADDNTNVLAYDAGFIDLFLNGIRLVNGTDFTATNGTSIVLTVGASLNDILEIVAYGTFELANFSIGDANDVSLAGVIDGQVLTWNASASSFQPGNASSAEVYGFNKDASGNLIVTTTDGGNDNISSSTFANFDDVLFAASGFTFSLSNGELIATI